MTQCMKCWSDSASHRYDGTGPSYEDLVLSRSCPPEDQAGVNALACNKCGMRTIHEITGECMNPECDGCASGSDAKRVSDRRIIEASIQREKRWVELGYEDPSKEELVANLNISLFHFWNTGDK